MLINYLNQQNFQIRLLVSILAQEIVFIYEKFLT